MTRLNKEEDIKKIFQTPIVFLQFIYSLTSHSSLQYFISLMILCYDFDTLKYLAFFQAVFYIRLRLLLLMLYGQYLFSHTFLVLYSFHVSFFLLLPCCTSLRSCMTLPSSDYFICSSSFSFLFPIFILLLAHFGSFLYKVFLYFIQITYFRIQSLNTSITTIT